MAAWFQKNPVLTDFNVFDYNFIDSELFNLALNPLDQYHPLLEFFTNRGTPPSLIILFRPRSQKPFNQHDQDLFVHLLPYLSHGIQNQAINELQYVEQGVTGMHAYSGA